MKQECIAIVQAQHGRWTYIAAVLYESGSLADGTVVWKKVASLIETTSRAKTERLAKAEADARGIPLLPHVRSNTPIVAGETVTTGMKGGN